MPVSNQSTKESDSKNEGEKKFFESPEKAQKVDEDGFEYVSLDRIVKIQAIQKLLLSKTELTQCRQQGLNLHKEKMAKIQAYIAQSSIRPFPF